MIQGKHGGHVYTLKRINPGWKVGNHLVYHGAEALSFLLSIEEHLILKRKQVELAKEFWEWTHQPKNVRCNRIQNPSIRGRFHHQIKPESDAKDREFKARMHDLNKKGA